MDSRIDGAGTPLLDFFKRGEVDREVRLMAAQGVLGLRPHEQLGLLDLLVTDQDPEVAQAAAVTLRAMSSGARRGEGERAASVSDTNDVDPKEVSTLQKIGAMTTAQRLVLAMRGTREERAILIRDPNRIVAVAVLSSPKITETEVESIAKMTNVSEDILRMIGHARAWVKNYAVVSALSRNPKTPVAVSLNMLPRLHETDVKMLATDRNIPDVLRLAARRKLTQK